MKKMKKLASIALALVLALALAIPAFADTAMGTITIENASKGATYTAYKLFDATVNDETRENQTTDPANGITYTGTIPSSLVDYFENVNGQIRKKTGINESDLFAALKTWAESAKNDANVQKFSGTGNGGPLILEVPHGYYVITSTIGGGTAITVDSTNAHAHVYDKNNAGTPTFPNDAKTTNVHSYDVGETVTYTLKLNTVNWIGAGAEAEQVTSYTIKDTVTATDAEGELMTGALSERAITSVVIMNGTTQEADLSEDYNKFNANNEITIAWTGANGSLYSNGAQIVITYSATVLKAGTIVNKLNASYEAGTQGGNVPEDPQPSETVYSSTIVIDKFETGNMSKKLPNAKFILSKTEGEGDNAVTTYYKSVNGEPTWVAVEANAEVLVTDANGAVTIAGLKDGTYYLTETAAPDGYNKLGSPEVVTVNAESGEHVVEYTAQVGNSAGAELPSTGGMGTTLFTTFGGLLMVGAAMLFVAKKRSIA